MRIFPRLIAVIICTIIVTGCSTRTPFYATGGSRADGTVDMAYDFTQFETPIIDRNQALSVAKRKCQVWGYEDAEAFGGKTQNCNARNGFGTCIQGQMVEKYQCIGDLGTSKQSPSLQRAPSASAASVATSSPDKKTWQDQQIQRLRDSDVSYEEYQRRYKTIMDQ